MTTIELHLRFFVIGAKHRNNGEEDEEDRDEIYSYIVWEPIRQPTQLMLPFPPMTEADFVS